MYAAIALGEVAKGGKELPKEALEALIKILNDPKCDSDAKRYAAEALGEVAKGGKELLRKR